MSGAFPQQHLLTCCLEFLDSVSLWSKGVKIWEAHLKDYKRTKIISWSRQGKLEFVQHYTDGVLHGDFVVYHPNGQVHKSGRYRHGDETGVWEEFDEQGNMVSSETR